MHNKVDDLVHVAAQHMEMKGGRMDLQVDAMWYGMGVWGDTI